MLHIVFAPDNNYVDYCCIAIKSIEENYIDDAIVCIYILNLELTEFNKSKLNRTVEKNDKFRITYVEIQNNSIIRKFNTHSHFTTAMYYRILIPNLLNENISKVIYLDCDILVRKNIAELWNIEINDYALGAISTVDFNNCDNLGIDEKYGYFNSGVLVINLNKWRTENYISKTLDYLLYNSTKLKLPDQDALNFILCKDWVEIPLKWNVRTTLYNSDKVGSDDLQYLHDPAIVHYTTYSKPWHYFNNHPYKEEYKKILEKCNYSLTIPSEIKRLCSKNIIIFGAGSSGHESKKILEAKKFELKYYCDNDKSKMNKKINGVEVIDPSKLIEGKDENIVIISSCYEEEIKEQLLSYNLLENVHFYREEILFSIKYDIELIDET